MTRPEFVSAALARWTDQKTLDEWRGHCVAHKLDIYRYAAARVLDVPMDRVTTEERQAAKGALFIYLFSTPTDDG